MNYYNYEVARVPVPVAKLESLESRLDHVPVGVAGRRVKLIS